MYKTNKHTKDSSIHSILVVYIVCMCSILVVYIVYIET